MPREQEIGDTSERVEVGASVELLAERHLRRHVGGGSRGEADGGDEELPLVRRGDRDLLDESEVEHFHEVVTEAQPADMDVRRLDVAMHETLGVCLLERLADLTHDVNRTIGRHRTMLPHERLEIHPVEQLHHKVQRVVFGHAEVVKLHGVG